MTYYYYSLLTSDCCSTDDEWEMQNDSKSHCQWVALHAYSEPCNNSSRFEASKRYGSLCECLMKWWTNNHVGNTWFGRSIHMWLGFSQVQGCCTTNNDYSNTTHCWYLPIYGTGNVYHWPSRCSCGCLLSRMFIHWTLWEKKSVASWNVFCTDNAKDLWVLWVSTKGTFGGPLATKATATMQFMLSIRLQEATKHQWSYQVTRWLLSLQHTLYVC